MKLGLFISVLAFAFLGSCGSGPTEVPNIIPKKDTARVKADPADSFRQSVLFPQEMFSPRKSAFDEYFVRIGTQNFYCGYKGKFEVADTLGKNKQFLFDLKAEYLIDKVYFHPIDSATFFVVWQETDHMGVGCKAALFKKGEAKPVWKHMYKDPEPGQIAVDGEFAYITTLGMVAKLNVFSGDYEWQHDSLFEPMKMRFKKFDRPLIYDNTVCFFDYPIRGRKNKRDTICVNDVDGKIIR